MSCCIDTSLSLTLHDGFFHRVTEHSDISLHSNATGQLQGYETVQPGSGEGGRGSLVGNPAYLTSPEVNLEQQLSKAGYEAMAPAPHSTNQQQEYSYVMI